MKYYKEVTASKSVGGTKNLLGPVNATKTSVNTSFLKWYLAHKLKLSEQMSEEKEIRVIYKQSGDTCKGKS